MFGILSDIKLDTLKTALRAGGFFGWYFTVMYICEQSLHYYHDDTLFFSVNQIFLFSALISALLFAVLLLFFDVEGLLNDKLLRWLPGILLGESGVALSFATAYTMKAFAAVAGAAYGFAALAILTTVLRVKVGQRLFALCLAAAMGSCMRLCATLVISAFSRTGLVIMSITAGLAAALVIHSEGYTKLGAPLISLAEAAPKKILSSVPGIYLPLFFIYGSYSFVYTRLNTLTGSSAVISMNTDDYAAYSAVVIAVMIIALSSRFYHLPLLCAEASLLTFGACAIATLNDMTEWEACAFSAVFMTSYAVMKVCGLTLVIIFSLDRPHPLFYSILGFSVLTSAELIGGGLGRHFEPGAGFCMLISASLVPLGAGLIHREMKHSGFTLSQLAHRSALRTQIKEVAGACGLTEREKSILQYIVIDGFTIDEIAEKLIISRNTAKVQQRTLLSKIGLSTTDELRDYFFERTGSAEAREEARLEREEHAKERKTDLKIRLREAELQSRKEEIIRRSEEKRNGE